MAQVAALAAIDDQSHVKRVVLNNAGQAQLVGVALSEMDYRVVPTSANFLYCDVGEDSGGIAQALRSEAVNMVVKSCAQFVAMCAEWIGVRRQRINRCGIDGVDQFFNIVEHGPRRNALTPFDKAA